MIELLALSTYFVVWNWYHARRNIKYLNMYTYRESQPFPAKRTLVSYPAIYHLPFLFDTTHQGSTFNIIT